MDIRRYQKITDEDKLMEMIKAEGEEWACYSDKKYSNNYKNALNKSITYVAYAGSDLCGYSRSINDFGFYIYVCDLLIKPKYRGKNIGKKLMECVLNDFPNQLVYVMSDVDEYYMGLGYKREGTIFEVRNIKRK